MDRVKKYIVEEQLDLKSRKREKVYPRWYLFKYLREHYKTMSLEWIGNHFNKDHATVIHGLRNYQLFENDELFLKHTEAVRMLFPLGVEDVGTFHSLTMFEILANQNKLVD